MKLWLKASICIIVLVAAGYVTSPIWMTWFQPPGMPEVVPLVKLTDANDDSACSPAGITVKMYDPHGLMAMPTADVAPFDFLDSLTETPDGEFTGTKTVLQGTWVYFYVTCTGYEYYIAGFFAQIPGPRSGTSGEANALGFKMIPSGYTASVYECGVANYYGDHVSMLLTTGGTAKTNATNLPTGTYNYDLAVTAASGYGFGYAGHIDPETGYYYRPAAVILDLDITTARGILTSSSLFDHFVIGVHEYWCLSLGQLFNDKDITVDGTSHLFFDLNNQAAAADVADFILSIGGRPGDFHAGSYGVNCENDLLRLIHFA